ncbi:pirin isoform X3 [Callithrix jacchus]|uniref:pirin isoform X3 n=1 Tax=Callithrix jacchus TaxID=9483 RepID=UPI00084000FA|nr:pirin isoform X3 [Callithrix jacchus]
MGSSKKVTLSVLSREQSEGVGARVRRSIGRPELKNLDPFLLFDEFKGGRPGGFPDHPHRGFETVSYLLEGGSMAHEDFCGHTGKLNPGDLQWMTAGRGILHAEMPCSEEPAHGLQLWVNLRSSEKMVEPQYQELKSEQIPKPSKDGVTVAVISGEALGIKSKIYTRTPTLYLDFKLDPGAKHSQPIPKANRLEEVKSLVLDLPEGDALILKQALSACNGMCSFSLKFFYDWLVGLFSVVLHKASFKVCCCALFPLSPRESCRDRIKY